MSDGIDPERCEHATGEPGWGGLRQPVTHAEQVTEYETLIEKTRQRTASMAKPNPLDDLADAVEALVELRQLRATQIQALQGNWELKAAEWERERGALRAQLDKVRSALDEYREHTLPGVWLAMRLADVAEWVEVSGNE